MEQSTITPETPETTAEESLGPDRSGERIFRYSEYVHVGEGADTCEHREDGRCADADHIHVWVRLPNKFQVQQIREKAQAGRARSLRQARDPESDRYAIIENQIEEARLAGREEMIAELLADKTLRYHHQAMSELVEEEDSGFETIEEDQKRWAVLHDQSPEEREDEDEYQELVRHLARWNEAVDKRFEELIQPERDALENQDDDELAALMRDIAVREQADGLFMRVFTQWQMIVCTLKPRDGQPVDRYFASPNELNAAPPELIEALEEAYRKLELDLNKRQSLRAEGN